MKMDISIVLIAYNEEKDIADCIRAILSQSIHDFELLIIDDGSIDKTGDEIRRFNDSRIIHITNLSNQGYASARNIGIKNSIGEIVFFTDADCLPEQDWLKQGLRVFRQDPKTVGIRGKTIFLRPASQYSAKDKAYGRPYFLSSIGPEYKSIPNTNNAVYRKDILLQVGGFDVRYNDGSEDVDLALRVIRSGGLIAVNENMLVYHKHRSLHIRDGLRGLKQTSNIVRLIKDHSSIDRKLLRSYGCYRRICLPLHLLTIPFPPLLYFLLRQKHKRIKNLNDIIYLIFFYISLFPLRLFIWKKAVQERIFLI